MQIAGLVARRILCDVDIGDRLRAGQVYGLIRFGSRVDIWVPVSAELMVLVGQRTLAGETILARLPATKKAPEKTPEKTSAKKPAKTQAKKAPAKPAAKTQPKKAAKKAAK